MEGAAADSQVFDMPTDAQMGGKKRRQTKKSNKGGAGVETVLAPAVLYGLRRLVTPGGKRNKQRGGDAFASQASPVGESTGPLLAVVPSVQAAGVAVIPPSVDMLPKEALAAPTNGGNASLNGGAKKGKKGKKGPMAEGRFGVKGKLGPLQASTGLYGKVKAWGGDGEYADEAVSNDTLPEQEGGKKKRKTKSKKGGDKDDDNKNKDNQDNNQQDGGKKKRKTKKGGDKDDDNKNDNQDGGKKKNKRSKKLKGGALDLYAKQLEQITSSLNNLLFN